MKVSKLRRLGEAILGMLMFVPWALFAHYIDSGLTELGLKPEWLVLVVSAVLGFVGAFAGVAIVVGLARIRRSRLLPRSSVDQASESSGSAR